MSTPSYWSSVVLHLPLDGDIQDKSNSAHTMTARGTAALTSVAGDFKFGGAGLNVPGSGSAIDTPGHADFNFGTGDFTVRGWVKTSDTDGGLIDYFESGFTTWQMFVEASKLSWYSGSTRIAQTSTNIATGALVHFEADRSSGTLYLFLDGTLRASAADASNYNHTSSFLSIGRQFVGSPSVPSDLIAKIDDVEIIKGVALHTASFTAPTAANPTVQTTNASGFLSGNFGTPVLIPSAVGFLASHFGTPVAAYTQFAGASGFLSSNFGLPRLVLIANASGFLSQSFGTPALIPSAVGFLASRFGTGTAHTTVTADASGFAAENIGTPTWRGITRHNAAALAPTSRVGTPTTPTERYTQAHGLYSVHVGDPVALRFIAPDLHQLADASGLLAFNSGTAASSATVSVAATGADAFHGGTPTAGPSATCAADGVAASNIGTPAAQMVAHAQSLRAVHLGVPTCARVFQAIGRVPQTRFGTPTYTRGAATHFAASAGRRTRFGQPKAFIGKVTYPAGFSAFHSGTPDAIEHHRASALPPNTRFGTPLLRRNPLC